jgi:hypothetical protein
MPSNPRAATGTTFFPVLFEPAKMTRVKALRSARHRAQFFLVE